jgi:hypothetical protein
MLVPVLFYRLPGGGAVTLEGEVQYQPSDSGQGDHVRYYFEHLCGNDRLLLVDGPVPWVYVSEADRKRCFEDSVDVSVKRYSIRATVQASPLLLGGFGPGRILAVRKVEK